MSDFEVGDEVYWVQISDIDPQMHGIEIDCNNLYICSSFIKELIGNILIRTQEGYPIPTKIIYKSKEECIMAFMERLMDQLPGSGGVHSAFGTVKQMFQSTIDRLKKG